LHDLQLILDYDMNYIQLQGEENNGGAILAKDFENSFHLTFECSGNDTIVFR